MRNVCLGCGDHPEHEKTEHDRALNVRCYEEEATYVGFHT